MPRYYGRMRSKDLIGMELYKLLSGLGQSFGQGIVSGKKEAKVEGLTNQLYSRQFSTPEQPGVTGGQPPEQLQQMQRQPFMRDENFGLLQQMSQLSPNTLGLLSAVDKAQAPNFFNVSPGSTVMRQQGGGPPEAVFQAPFKPPAIRQQGPPDLSPKDVHYMNNDQTGTIWRENWNTEKGEMELIDTGVPFTRTGAGAGAGEKLPGEEKVDIWMVRNGVAGPLSKGQLSLEEKQAELESAQNQLDSIVKGNFQAGVDWDLGYLGTIDADDLQRWEEFKRGERQGGTLSDDLKPYAQSWMANKAQMQNDDPLGIMGD